MIFAFFCFKFVSLILTASKTNTVQAHKKMWLGDSFLIEIVTFCGLLLLTFGGGPAQLEADTFPSGWFLEKVVVLDPRV